MHRANDFRGGWYECIGIKERNPLMRKPPVSSFSILSWGRILWFVKIYVKGLFFSFSVSFNRDSRRPVTAGACDNSSY